MIHETSRPFDVAAHLDIDETIAFFLDDAADGSPEEFIHALNTVARAKGMTEITKALGCRLAVVHE